MEKLFNFDESLYRLNVEGIPKEEIPNMSEKSGTIVCYTPTKDQLIHLALIVWQVATRNRDSFRKGTSKFLMAEDKVTRTRNALKSLLLPYVAGNAEKARDLCATLLHENKPVLDKYIKQWSIIKRPSSVWVDKDARGIFLCENEGRILVGLNPTNYVFTYDEK